MYTILHLVSIMNTLELTSQVLDKKTIICSLTSGSSFLSRFELLPVFTEAMCMKIKALEDDKSLIVDGMPQLTISNIKNTWTLQFADKLSHIFVVPKQCKDAWIKDIELCSLRIQLEASNKKSECKYTINTKIINNAPIDTRMDIQIVDESGTSIYQISNCIFIKTYWVSINYGFDEKRFSLGSSNPTTSLCLRRVSADQIIFGFESHKSAMFNIMISNSQLEAFASDIFSKSEIQ